jgi:DNA-binding phage protein
MLSLSADITKSDVDLKLVNGDKTASAGDIRHGHALMNFAEAIASRDEEALASARNALLEEAGAEVLVDAAAVAANFQRMVRIADSTGIPLDQTSAALSYAVAKDLDLQRFESAKNTPPGGLKIRMLSWIAKPLAKRMFR